MIGAFVLFMEPGTSSLRQAHTHAWAVDEVYQRTAVKLLFHHFHLLAPSWGSSVSSSFPDPCSGCVMSSLFSGFLISACHWPPPPLCSVSVVSSDQSGSGSHAFCFLPHYPVSISGAQVFTILSSVYCQGGIPQYHLRCGATTHLPRAGRKQSFLQCPICRPDLEYFSEHVEIFTLP
ncbi:hypothetical protein OE88DRAFT_568796 [Heliocybe sulcata]|uniref:Uncharacterized protein n=1 Tax=Heliocybe sulcata TaxID=5364 RepID=A0A5C3MU06_9AGAM|nr:hypothetical protein OE88DRAFT_568796 [Heliocybe sulcata]